MRKEIPIAREERVWRDGRYFFLPHVGGNGRWNARSQHEPGNREEGRKPPSAQTSRQLVFPFLRSSLDTTYKELKTRNIPIGHTADPDVSLFSLFLVVVY